jgi:hypothetical protein
MPYAPAPAYSSQDLDFLITAISITAEVGGNLAKSWMSSLYDP